MPALSRRLGNDECETLLFRSFVRVGAGRDGGLWIRPGAAWIFTRANGAWTESKKLAFSGQAVAINDSIGASVAISGDGMTAIVGAPVHTDNYGGHSFSRSPARIGRWTWSPATST